MFMELWRRLVNKTRSMVPILLGALFLSLVLSGVAWLFQLLGPPELVRQMSMLGENDFATNKELLRDYFLSFGSFTEAVFLGVQFLQVLLAPIPGQLIGLLGGFLFGFWKGILITMVGLTLGSLVAIVLSRWIGEHLVRRFVPGEVMARFDYLLARGKPFDFFMIFLLPALPDDAVCFLAGLTRLPVGQLVLVCLLGRFPGMAVLTFTGSNLETNMVLAQYIFVVAMVLAVVLWLYDDKVEAWVRGRK